MKVTTEQFKRTALAELDNARTQQFLQILPLRLSARRKTAYESFPDPVAAHAYGHAVRGEAVERLPELLQTFEKNALANGARIYWAEDSRAANDYIVNLALQKGVRYVTKGKSMITEELGLNEALAQNGIIPWETDLGEFIAQLLEKPPFISWGRPSISPWRTSATFSWPRGCSMHPPPTRWPWAWPRGGSCGASFAISIWASPASISPWPKPAP
jgi:hypothetical protein